jgi:hypothetical protein
MKSGDCYVSKRAQGGYDVYRILEYSELVSGSESEVGSVRFESVMVAPDGVFSRGVCSDPEVFYFIANDEKLLKVPDDVFDLIERRCKGFKAELRALLDCFDSVASGRIAEGLCFAADLGGGDSGSGDSGSGDSGSGLFALARVSHFQEVVHAVGVVLVPVLKEPGGEVHGEFFTVGNYEMRKARTWCLYDEVFMNPECRCRVYPPSVFEEVDKLLSRCLKSTWQEFLEFLEFLEFVQEIC